MNKFAFLLPLVAVACSSPEAERARNRVLQLREMQLTVLSHAFPGEVITWRPDGSPAPEAIGVVCRVHNGYPTIAIVGQDTCETALNLPPYNWYGRYSGYTIESSFNNAALPYGSYLTAVRYGEQ